MHRDAHRTLPAIFANMSVLTWSMDDLLTMCLMKLESSADETLSLLWLQYSSVRQQLPSSVSLPRLVTDVSKYFSLIFLLTDAQLRKPMIGLTAVARGEWKSSGGKDNIKNWTNQFVAENKGSRCFKWPSHTLCGCFPVLVIRWGRKCWSLLGSSIQQWWQNRKRLCF